MESDGRVDTLFVVVVVALILVEEELAVGARVDAQLDGIRGLLAVY